MITTGSRNTKLVVVRLLVGALLLVAFAGVSSLLTRSTSAGSAGTVTVNTVANSDDGECEGAPNAGSGNCSFREAINSTNDGDANKIMFHPAVFGTNNKGIINVGAGLGGLPTITTEITIDATNRGVVLDGDADGDDDFCDDEICTTDWDAGPFPTDGALGVVAQHHGFDFTLMGGGNFVIRNIEGSAIVVDGNDFSLGEVAISGVITQNIGDENADNLNAAGILIFNAVNLNDISVTDSNIEADGTAVDIRTVFYPNDLTDGSVEVTGNRIVGDHDDDGSGTGVIINYFGDLGDAPPDPVTETLTTVVSDNESIEGGVHGVEVEYCDDVQGGGGGVAGGDPEFEEAEGCDLERSNINVEISNNGRISGGVSDAIVVDINSAEQDGGDANSVGDNSSNNVLVDITDNGTIDNDVDDAVDVDVFVCCGHSHSTSTVNVSGNAEINGQQDGVDIENSVCCGNDNHATTNVTENDDITGQSAEGVDVYTAAGNFDDSFNGACCSADDNIAETHVDDNGRIDGGGDDGVDVDTFAGGFNGNADHNTGTTTINGNNDIDGDGDGVEVYTAGGSFDDDEGADSADADDNVATTEVNDNGRIHGDDSDGVNAFSEAGSCLDDAGCEGDADTNTARTDVLGNEEIDGEGDDGVFAGAFAFASEDGEADENTGTANVNENGDIEGSEDGIDVEAFAGGDTEGFDADGNHAKVAANDNGRVVGHDEAGIYAFTESGSDSCCKEPELGQDNSAATVIEGNELIRGEGDNDNDNTHGVDVDAQVCCDEANQNVVDINDNGEIYALGADDGDGIYIGGSDGYAIDSNQDGEFDERGIGYGVNIVTITNNELIRGEGDGANGIHYVSDILAEIELDHHAEHESLNILTIRDNLLRDSGQDGISICCGIFDSEFSKRPSVEGKSVISENTIYSNDDDGIDIDSSSGINVGPSNVIQNNGLKGQHEPVIGAGGPPNPEAGNGVEIGNTISWQVWDGCTGPSLGDDPLEDVKCLEGEVELFADSNHITQNSIFDNAALGIDLVGLDITDEDGDAACDPFDGKDFDCLDEGVVGCNTFAKATIDPNDCLPMPLITVIAATDKVAGNACPGCIVELFLVDATPANQTGPGIGVTSQYGEGRTYLVTGTADDAGDYSIILPCGLSAGSITATATDKLKNTSEFSANHPMLGTRTCATPTNTAPPPLPTATVGTPLPTSTVGPTNTSVPPVPTNTPVTPVPTLAGKACGDVNDDGNTNSIDATILLQLKAGLIEPEDVANLESGDVNGDGDITSVDAALVLQLEAGLIQASDLDCPA